MPLFNNSTSKKYKPSTKIFNNNIYDSARSYMSEKSQTDFGNHQSYWQYAKMMYFVF